MNYIKGKKIILWLGSLNLALFLLMLAFRAFIYPGIYIAPEDPYGMADIIGFFLRLLMYALYLISTVVAGILLATDNRRCKKSATILLLLCLLLFVTFTPLHEMAARFSS